MPWASQSPTTPWALSSSSMLPQALSPSSTMLQASRSSKVSSLILPWQPDKPPSKMPLASKPSLALWADPSSRVPQALPTPFSGMPPTSQSSLALWASPSTEMSRALPTPLRASYPSEKAQGYHHTRDEPRRDSWCRRSQDSERRSRSCPERRYNSIDGALAKETPLPVGRICRHCGMSFPSNNKLHRHLRADCNLTMALGPVNTPPPHTIFPDADLTSY